MISCFFNSGSLPSSLMTIINIKHCRRLSSAAAKSAQKHRFLMPDTSTPKWERREKLNLINFANKGKRNQRSSGGGLKKTKYEQDLGEMEQRRLPRDKLSPLPTSESPFLTKLASIDGNDRGALVPLDSKSLKRELARQSQEIASGLLSCCSDDGLLPLSKSDIAELANSDSVSDLTAAFAQDLLNTDQDAFRAVTSRDYVKVIYLNAKQGRSEEAQRAFDLMVDEGIEPSLVAYNVLMEAYANDKNVKQCIRIFEQIKQHPDAAMKPDSVSYGTLIKALVKSRKLSDAFALYTEMKQSGLQVSMPIFSTLIDGCSKMRDYNRAWKLFEHVRSTQFRPDQILYNQMIHLCAVTGNTEQALSLFDQMRHSGLYPLDSSFNSLIHACARRPDYYQKTFELVAQMQEQGFIPDTRTYNYMLNACSLMGDVHRAKALYSEMTILSNDNPDYVSPNTVSIANLLTCYGRLPGMISRIEYLEKWAAEMDQFKLDRYEATVGLANAERMKEEKKPIDVTEWMMDPDYDPDEGFSLKDAFGKSYQEIRGYLYQGQEPQLYLESVKNEMKSAVDAILSKLTPNSFSSSDNTELKNGKEVMSLVTIDFEDSRPLLMNSMLHALGSFGCRDELVRVYDKAFDELQLPKDQFSYFYVIDGLVGNNSATLDKDENDLQYLEKALSCLAEYEKFRTLKKYPNDWRDLQAKFVKQQVLSRGITHQHRKQDYRIYKSIINALTEHDDLYRAVSYLRLLIHRGHASVAEYNLYNAVSEKDDIADENAPVPMYDKPKTLFRPAHFSTLLEKVEMNAPESLKEQLKQILFSAKTQVAHAQDLAIRKQIRK